MAENRLIRRPGRFRTGERPALRKRSRMKERLDVLLVNRNLAQSREKAKAIIMSGIVFVDGQKEDKAGTAFEDTVHIEVRGNTLKYVSRGGLKLEKAMTCFGIELEGRVCMDVGASTGGFTDCMLQNGAVKVYAVDVGHGQLDWKLRNDRRVVCMEKTNIRYVTGEHVPDPIQFASIDVSFISLTKVLGPVKALLTGDGQVVCLIKPQFEAGREKVGKKGVVREKSTHLEVIEAVTAFAGSIGFEILNLEFSPIKGPEGNIEYLLYLQNHPLRDGKPQEMLKAAGKAGDIKQRENAEEPGETGRTEKAEMLREAGAAEQPERDKESGAAGRRTEAGQAKAERWSFGHLIDAKAVVEAAHKSL